MSGRRLHFVDFGMVVQCLTHSAWAAANLAELACYVGNMVELPKLSQQNICHTVQPADIGLPTGEMERH